MGVLDFLSDLSKASKKDELGLGGMRSLLGTRGAAPKGKRGDEMMSRTSSDSLPGYFDPETREYVPWYVDLFDGGGLNKSEGLLSDAQKVTTAADMLNTNGAPVQRAGQMAPGLGSQLSDMEMANRNRAAQMAPGLGSQLSDMEMANRNRASQVARNDAIHSARVQEANRGAANAMSNQRDPRLYSASTGYAPGAMTEEFLDKKIDLGAAGYGPMGQAPAPAQRVPQSIPASGGNMAINTPAAQGRDQMIADQQMSNMEQAMRNHPLYPEYVDFLNRSNMPSTPSLFQQYVNMFGRN